MTDMRQLPNDSEHKPLTRRWNKNLMSYKKVLSLWIEMLEVTVVMKIKHSQIGRHTESSESDKYFYVYFEYTHIFFLFI